MRLWRSPICWPRGATNPVQIRWKSYVSFPLSWGRCPSLMRRNRLFLSFGLLGEKDRYSPLSDHKGLIRLTGTKQKGYNPTSTRSNNTQHLLSDRRLTRSGLLVLKICTNPLILRSDCQILPAVHATMPLLLNRPEPQYLDIWGRSFERK